MQTIRGLSLIRAFDPKIIRIECGRGKSDKLLVLTKKVVPVPSIGGKQQQSKKTP